jgi:hypothetical protein
MELFISIVNIFTCSCLQEFDVRLVSIVCLLHMFTQSICAMLYLSYLYLMIPSLGIFFSIFFIFQIRQLGNHLSGYLLWLFIAQQICSVYAIMYGISNHIAIELIILYCYFLLIATIGVCASYRLDELIRYRSTGSTVSILPLSQD